MLFDLYKPRFEKEMGRFISEMGEPGILRDACEYALEGGKRLRPLIVLMIADSLDQGLDVMPAAFSVECFHSASLIADDFPCMDNDSLRRGRPSLHKAFGEGTALLASYTLIAEGYGGISKCADRMRGGAQFRDEADRRSVLCLESATRCAGLRGATQGQFLDLFPPDSGLKTIQEIIYKKTVTLFEISFVFGWVFGGGDLSVLPLVRACASHLGAAFQIADDLEDAMQDVGQESSINIASALGRDRAISLFDEEIASFKRTLLELNLWTPPFKELFESLSVAV